MKLRHLIILTGLLIILGNTYAQEDSVYATISGDSVTICNTNILGNCASEFKFSVALLENDSIIITETDTIGPIANCICYYDLSVSLAGLAVGHYTVYVYRERLSRYFYEMDTIKYIGSATFDIIYLPSVNYSEEFYLSECIEHTGISEEIRTPNNYSLEDSHPNPFNNSVLVNYTLPLTTDVTLKIYDLLGREISTLVSERKPAGEYTVSWDAENVPSGVYFYRLTAGEFTQTKKMMVIK